MKPATCSVRVGHDRRQPCGKLAVAEVRVLGTTGWRPICREHADQMRQRVREVRDLPTA